MTATAPLDAAAHQALQAAVAALQGGHPDEAEQIAVRVLGANPGHPVAAGILGRAMMLQNRAAEALPVLEQAARQGGNAAVETQYADALAATGQRDAALAQLRQTMARGFPPSFVMFARYSAEAGQHDDAIAALVQGLELFPGAWELENELALQHIKAGDRAAARAVLSRALAPAPGHPILLMSWGQLLYLDGDYAAAADAFRRAHTAHPGDAAALVNLGAAHLEMAERDTGEAQLRAAVRAAPQLAGRAASVLAHASHGRFFLRQDALADFLQGKA